MNLLVRLAARKTLHLLVVQRIPHPLAELRTSKFEGYAFRKELRKAYLKLSGGIMKPYFAIQWHITDVCDQRCKHCYIFSEGHPQLITTPLDELKSTYTQIKDFCDKIERTPYIYLTGGDPILHPNFWELLEMFKADGTRFCIMGNPFHLTDEVCVALKDCGCVKYQLSLDGLEQTHDMFRKQGSFQTTLNAIKTIKRSGMWCAVMSTVSKTNMHEIPALIDLVDFCGVDVFAVGRYCPTSVEKAYDKDIHIPPANIESFWKSVGKSTNSTKIQRLRFSSRTIYGVCFSMKKAC